nr:hypothetical protein HAGR004_19540 [Bdellovibrio sp. HAGR004]
MQPLNATNTDEQKINESNTTKKGNNLNSDFNQYFRFLEQKEKKNSYVLLETGEFKDVILSQNDKQLKTSNLPKRFAVSYGYNWGYLGTGPSDLALNLALHFSNNDLAFAHTYYQDLLEDIVQHLPLDQDVLVNAGMLLEWVKTHRSQKPRHNTTYRPEPCDENCYYDDDNMPRLRSKMATEVKTNGRKYVRQ